MTVTVVSGPPCAGKTTYIAENGKDDDVVVDLDALAAALDGLDGPPRGVAFAARAAAIDHILSGVETDAWIVDTNLLPDSQARYAEAGADFVVLDPGVDVCLERAAGRPDGTGDVIRGWYAARSQESKQLRECALRLAHCFPDRLDEILAVVRVRCSGKV